MRQLLLVLLLSFSALQSSAQAFDLAGPKVDIHVKRGSVTLPIGEVSNLLPGDRLWIHPDFPDSQSARYVLIVAFPAHATGSPGLRHGTGKHGKKASLSPYLRRRSRPLSSWRRKQAETSAPCAMPFVGGQGSLSAPARTCRRRAGTGCALMPTFLK